MTTRRHLLAGTAAAIAAGGLLTRPARAHAVPDLDLQLWMEEQEDFLINKQVASGALRGPYDHNLQPYFSNWAAQGLAAANTVRSREALGNYISWYLDHLNTAAEDPYGIAGTVSDWHYDAATGEETSTGEYSSTDAGTTVPMITAFDAHRTGDVALQQLVMDNLAKYELMAKATCETTWGVRNSDGLCWARPDSKMKYVQDNAVVYRGLFCLAWLEKQAGRMTQYDYYTAKAEQTRKAIIDILWHEDRQNWSWGRGVNLLKESDPKAAFMPDAWCQYWQVQLRILPAINRRSVASWSAFSAANPRWMHLEFDNSFPHTEMAYSAVQMGELDNAATMLATCRERFAGNGWALPWYHGEAGHSMRVARRLIDAGWGQ